MWKQKQEHWIEHEFWQQAGWRKYTNSLIGDSGLITVRKKNGLVKCLAEHTLFHLGFGLVRVQEGATLQLSRTSKIEPNLKCGPWLWLNRGLRLHFDLFVAVQNFHVHVQKNTSKYVFLLHPSSFQSTCNKVLKDTSFSFYMPHRNSKYTPKKICTLLINAPQSLFVFARKGTKVIKYFFFICRIKFLIYP